MARIQILGDAAADESNSIIGGILRAAAWPVLAIYEGTKRVIDAATGGPTVGPQVSSSGGGEATTWPESIPEVPEAKAGIRASSGSGTATGYEEPYASPGDSGASPWPWIIGLAVLGGAGYGVYRIVKKRKRGK